MPRSSSNRATLNMSFQMLKNMLHYMSIAKSEQDSYYVHRGLETPRCRLDLLSNLQQGILLAVAIFDGGDSRLDVISDPVKL